MGEKPVTWFFLNLDQFLINNLWADNFIARNFHDLIYWLNSRYLIVFLLLVFLTFWFIFVARLIFQKFLIYRMKNWMDNEALWEFMEEYKFNIGFKFLFWTFLIFTFIVWGFWLTLLEDFVVFFNWDSYYSQWLLFLFWYDETSFLYPLYKASAYLLLLSSAFIFTWNAINYFLIYKWDDMVWWRGMGRWGLLGMGRWGYWRGGHWWWLFGMGRWGHWQGMFGRSNHWWYWWGYGVNQWEYKFYNRMKSSWLAFLFIFFIFFTVFPELIVDTVLSMVSDESLLDVFSWRSDIGD